MKSHQISQYTEKLSANFVLETTSREIEKTKQLNTEHRTGKMK